MTRRLGRKYPEDDLEPLAVTPLDWEFIWRWRAIASELRTLGYTYSEIAREVGVHKSSVRRYLDPEARRRDKIRQAERERERREEDSEYAEKISTYMRKHAQLNAEKRWEKYKMAKKYFVSETCRGESCWCSRPAEHKVEESVPPDDPSPGRHPLTAYVCHEHFMEVMGQVARRR